MQQQTLPIKSTTFLLDAPAGVLEVAYAVAPAQSQAITAIICHPHPLHGGTMSNKVVTTLERTLVDKGINALRFNFRGVGKSTGEHGHGKGELEDLNTVIQWLQTNHPHQQLILAGFSFGAYIAAQAAISYSPKVLISVAPAVTNQDYQQVETLTCPWIIIQGEQDEVIVAEKVFDWIAALPRKVILLRFPDAGHFFHGHLLALREQLSNALTTVLLG